MVARPPGCSRVDGVAFRIGLLAGEVVMAFGFETGAI
jgi:hypothetical protein